MSCGICCSFCVGIRLEISVLTNRILSQVGHFFAHIDLLDTMITYIAFLEFYLLATAPSTTLLSSCDSSPELTKHLLYFLFSFRWSCYHYIRLVLRLLSKHLIIISTLLLLML